MHKLLRGSAPKCLSKYDYRRDRWSLLRPTTEDKREIWGALHAMQGRRCAYCEAEIVADNCHIEHFRQRRSYAKGTFDWANLFGSCDRKDTCGKHKDSCGPYVPEDLVKPDEDDPDKYFVFAAGSIDVRDDLRDEDRCRAEETIRVLNLKYGPLCYMRKHASIGYLQTAELFCKLAEEFPPEEWLPMLQAEIDAITGLPFATAIRHTLMIGGPG